MEYLTLNPKDERSDEEILALSLKKPALFAEIVARYEEAFLRKALHILKNEEDAEDIVQETFTKIYLHGAKFKEMPGASFKSWAYKILINTSFTWYERRKGERMRTVALTDELSEILPDQKGELMREGEELSDYVVSILSRMPTQFSRLLRAYFLDGKSQQEIAEEEGSSVAAVKTRMHRAKESFRKASLFTHFV